MISQQLMDVVQQLGWDCQRGRFIPYEEGDLRAEAYTRLQRSVRNTDLIVNTEVRFHPYGGSSGATRCDVVVWDKWPVADGRLSLKEQKPKLAVEFKFWGDSPSKMIGYFEADIERLANLVPRGCGVAFLYVARLFRGHEEVLDRAKALDGRYGIKAIVVDGTKVPAPRQPSRR